MSSKSATTPRASRISASDLVHTYFAYNCKPYMSYPVNVGGIGLVIRDSWGYLLGLEVLVNQGLHLPVLLLVVLLQYLKGTG